MSDKRARAQRYAQAAVQAITEQWQTTFERVTDLLAQNQSLNTLVRHSSQPFEERVQALLGALPDGVSAEQQNMLKLLVQEGDLDLVSEIGVAMNQVASGQQQPIKAEVVSAVELSDEEKDSLRQLLIKQ